MSSSLKGAGHSQSQSSQPPQYMLSTVARPPPAVEHVQVGSYRFPLYSHPLFRVRLAENAYVEERVQSCLRDPALYSALDDLVESLLNQGRAGASMEDIQQLMEAQLGGLDAYWLHAQEASTTTTTTTAEADVPRHVALDHASVGGAGASGSAARGAMLPSLVPASQAAWSSPVTVGTHSNTNKNIDEENDGGAYQLAEEATHRQGRYLSSTHDALMPSVSPHAKHRAGVLSDDFGADADAAASSAATAHMPPASQTRNYFTLPAVTPAVVPTRTYMATNTTSTVTHSLLPNASAGGRASAWRETTGSTSVPPDDSPLPRPRALIPAGSLRGGTRTTKKRHQGETGTGAGARSRKAATAAAAAAAGSTWNTGATLPQWRGACRDAVYSLLHIRLEEAVLDGGPDSDSQEEAARWQGRQARMLEAIADAREHQRALDGATLATMAPSAYAALDVTLDGNSTCLSHRTQSGVAYPRVKIMAQSRALCAQRPQPTPSALTQPHMGGGGGGGSQRQKALAGSTASSAQSVKARRVAAEHQRTVAQAQARRREEEQQEQRRRAGLDLAPAWW